MGFIVESLDWVLLCLTCFFIFSLLNFFSFWLQAKQINHLTSCQQAAIGTLRLEEFLLPQKSIKKTLPDKLDGIQVCLCTYQQLNLFLLLSYLSISGFKGEEVWQASYSWNALSKPWAREVKSINRNNHRYSSWEPDCCLLFLALPMTQLVTSESHFTPPFSSFLTGKTTHPTGHPGQRDPVSPRWGFCRKSPILSLCQPQTPPAHRMRTWCLPPRGELATLTEFILWRKSTITKCC